MSILKGHYCVINDEGALVLPVCWGDGEKPCPWRFFPVQMWDDDESFIPQPYDTPEEYEGDQPDGGFWIIDLENLPSGWEMLTLSKTEWEETQIDTGWKQWDSAEQKVILRPYFTKDTRGKIREDQNLEVTHWRKGGEPCFRLKPGSTKREQDFPGLRFKKEKL